MKLRFGISALLAAASITVASAQPTTVQGHVDAARTAAGGNFGGLLSAICPANRTAAAGGRGAGPGRGAAGATAARGAAPARVIPDRATWYAKPYKAFDNLYFVGTKVHSAWVLQTSQGLIVIDTLYDYAVEPEIVEGIRALKLDPAQIKYVLVGHAHGDHDQGAALLQSRYGARVVMGAPDWDTTLARAATYAGGNAKKGPNDISVGPEGAKIVLGDTTVDVMLSPGHTPGTISMTFPVKDRGRTLMAVYSGGTAFNFPQDKAHYRTYADTQRKVAAAGAAVGATVLLSNHSQWDSAYDRVRLTQLREPGETHPLEIGANAVQGYFTMTQHCAEARGLEMAN
jgi:metallo-beta-lactamase class B